MLDLISFELLHLNSVLPTPKQTLAWNKFVYSKLAWGPDKNMQFVLRLWQDLGEKCDAK